MAFSSVFSLFLSFFNLYIFNIQLFFISSSTISIFLFLYLFNNSHNINVVIVFPLPFAPVIANILFLLNNISNIFLADMFSLKINLILFLIKYYF